MQQEAAAAAQQCTAEVRQFVEAELERQRQARKRR
jgi:hypothetical protein